MGPIPPALIILILILIPMLMLIMILLLLHHHHHHHHYHYHQKETYPSPLGLDSLQKHNLCLAEAPSRQHLEGFARGAKRAWCSDFQHSHQGAMGY
jgi:hypothetical protein